MIAVSVETEPVPPARVQEAAAARALLDPAVWADAPGALVRSLLEHLAELLTESRYQGNQAIATTS